MIRYVSLFSGIEAASVAWKPLGWESVAFAEVDSCCCELLKRRFPNVPNLGDVTQIDWEQFKEKYGTVDLVVGGSPCQSFSIAGDRTGRAGASGLMYEYIRAVQELRPKWFVWENVAGALSCEKGAAFGQLLSEMDKIGYGLAWRVLDAQFFGVPQRRERVFLVGSLGNTGAAEVLFDEEGLRRDFVAGRKKRESLTRECENGNKDVSSCTLKLRHTGSPLKAALGGSGALIQNELSATVSAVQDQTLVVFGKKPTIRRLTPLESERLQGFPDGWTDFDSFSDNARYRMIGNSMAVPVMRWIGERIEQYG